LRNRWILAITILLAALALALGFLGSAPTGTVKVDPLTVTVVSLSSLSIFLIPLLALLLSYDAIVGEAEGGTLALMLTYPLSRGQIAIGKFLGHLSILALATLLGYGFAGLALQAVRGEISLAAWEPFFALIGASILLGASFLAMGYLISARVRARSTAAGIALGVWLFFVVIYDMALLGALVADQGRSLGAAQINMLLLLNPSDVYRLLNLTGYENTAMFSGMAGLSKQTGLGMPLLVAVQLAWIALPFGLACALFKRRQI
jgi:Cu-processing system permease protein